MPTLHVQNKGSIEIYYEARGEGPPVILIGGLTSTAAVWGLQIPALASRYQVITPDNRGSGRTRLTSDDGVRTPARFAGDVLALIDGLELDRVHLAGASMGGMIVQEFARHHADRLRSLTIMCSTFGGERATHPTREVISAMAAGSGADASDEEKRAMQATNIHPDTPRLRPEQLAFYEGTKTAEPHSSQEIALRMAGMADFNVYDEIAKLTLPVLVMAGSHDVLIPTANASKLVERIPGARKVIVEDAGHVFFAEQPEACNQALLDFLSEVEDET